MRRDSTDHDIFPKHLHYADDMFLLSYRIVDFGQVVQGGEK